MKTTEQYRKELLQKNRPFVCVDEYVGANTKNLHRCVTCGYEFMATPHVILRSGVCPKCSTMINSHEKYAKKLSEDRPDMEVLEEYKGNKIAILHRHSCGYEYKISPQRVLYSTSKNCPNCFREKRKKTDEEFKEKIKPYLSNYSFVGKYEDSHKKIKVVCNNGHESYVFPHNLIRGHRCKQCYSNEWGIKCRLSHKEYVERINKLYPNITVLSEYTTSDSPIRYRCSTCGIEATLQHSYSLLNYGCNCNRPNGEKVISTYLSSLGVDFIPQIKFEGLIGKSKKLSYDFGLPQYKLLIEYQGEQHERPVEIFGGEESFKIQQEHDKRKKEWAENNGYDILYIWYYDYDKIEDILKECLKSKSVETAG